MTILQFEIERKRVAGYPKVNSLEWAGAVWKYQTLLEMALNDTLKNGGTFVLVVSEDKVTAVQHADAKPL